MPAHATQRPTIIIDSNMNTISLHVSCAATVISCTMKEKSQVALEGSQVDTEPSQWTHLGGEIIVLSYDLVECDCRTRVTPVEIKLRSNESDWKPPP